eukprot:c14497_g1_i1 orf=421-2823(-)
MGIWKFFDRKKPIQCVPNSRSSVHPTKSNGQDVNRAKVKELLGAKTQQESWEVDKLLDRACWQDPTSTLPDDDDVSEQSTDCDSIKQDEEEDDCITKPQQANQRCNSDLPHSCAPQAKRRSSSDVPLPSTHVEKPVYAHLPQYTSASTKPIKEHGTRKPGQTDMPLRVNSVQRTAKTYKGARPPKLTVVNSSRSVRPRASHPIRMKNEISLLPGEKHFLPTPQTRTSGDDLCIAHPLPQPPLSGKNYNVYVSGHPDDKRPTSITRAGSCEAPIKPIHLGNKEYEAIVKAVTVDPSRQLRQKSKASQSAGASFPALPQGPQNTPPTTPRQQLHQTLQNTPPTTPRAQPHPTPLNTPPTTLREQPHQAPQSTPPATAHALLHPQVFINVSHTTQSPPSSKRQSPKLNLTTYNQRQPHQTSTPHALLHPPAHINVTQSPPSSNRQSPSRQSPTSNLTTHNQSQPHFSSQHTPFVYSPPCSPLPRSLCPRKWKTGVILGQGTFGTVYEGWNLEDGSFFAVKVSGREDISPEIQQEVDVLSKLEHQNIVRYLGSSIVNSRLCIFLELVRMGSLDSILRKFKRFGDDTIRSYTRQILLGLEYLHAKKTIHRDIKCGNILVDVNGQVKLSDFGIAKQVGESLASSVKGTPLYMAPEVLLPTKDCYSFPADIWSLGCTVLEMADGKPPWSNLEGFGFLFKVKRGELPPMPTHLSREGKDFICSCLKYHPKDRPTASKLLQHPFVLNVPTPESWSPPSPLSPKLWPPGSQFSSNTWAYENRFPTSPSQVTGFDQELAGSQRAQTLIHGR